MRSATDPPGKTSDESMEALIQALYAGPGSTGDRYCRYCGDEIHGERCLRCDSEVLARMTVKAGERRGVYE